VNGTIRGVIVAIAICSWFAISNHCAFAAFAQKLEAPPSACPFHSEPAKPKAPSCGTQCCKTLRAVVFAMAKSWTRDDAKFSNVDHKFAQPTIFAAAYHVLPLLLDTGPPCKSSFVELIRSMRAHAPPQLD
jgi:hypothetical protein